MQKQGHQAILGSSSKPHLEPGKSLIGTGLAQALPSSGGTCRPKGGQNLRTGSASSLLLLRQKSLAGPRWHIWPKGQPLGWAIESEAPIFSFRRHHSWLAPEPSSPNCRTPGVPGNDAGRNDHVGFGTLLHFCDTKGKTRPYNLGQSREVAPQC